MNTMSITPKRLSPNVAEMGRYVAKDGTIWAFNSAKKMDGFIRKKAYQRKSKNFLSPREILSQQLGLTNPYEI